MAAICLGLNVLTALDTKEAGKETWFQISFVFLLQISF